MREMKQTGLEWEPKIPSNWKIERIQWYLEEVKEKNEPVKTMQVLSLTNNRGVIPYEEKGEQGNKAKEDYSQYKIAYKNTIVANSMNILIGSVGISKYEGCVSPVYYVFKANEKASLEYFNYVFSTTQFQKELRKYASGILEIRLRVSANDILKRKIGIPSIEEQKKIVDIIERQTAKIDALIANQEAQIEKLKAYKQSLITEVVTKGLDKNVPMKDSGVEWIGNIPSHWDMVRVRNIGTTQNGISKGGEFFGEGFPFVSYSDVYKNYELPQTGSGLIKSTKEEQETYSVKTGDIFFTRTSETIEEVGFSSICTKNIENATFAGFLIRLRPFNSLLDNQYAKYYFRGEHIRSYLVKEMNLVTRASLGQDLLKSMNVLIPPQEEQRKIADYLNNTCLKIDKIISIKQQKIEKLNQYKKSLIYEYVTGKKEVV